MALENLKSIFKDGFNDQLEDYTLNRPVDRNDTRLPSQPLNGATSLPSLPSDESFMDGLSWESLYNPNHSFKEGAGHKGLIPINYPNSSRDKLNILDIDAGFRTANIGQIGGLLNNASVQNIDDFFTSRGVEPYIVSQIGDRETTLGGRGLPVNRMVTDAIRLSKYLSSPAGVLFIGKQESLGLQGQKYRKFYNPLSTIISAGFRAGAGPASLLDRTQPNIGDMFKKNEYPLFNPNEQPGGEDSVKDAVISLASGESLVESLSQGSPLGVNGLLNSYDVATSLNNFIPNRFGPFRPGQKSGITKIEEDIEYFFLGNDALANRDIPDIEIEVAEKYPNFNPIEESVSPLQIRGGDIESDFDFADFNRFESNFGPFNETIENDISTYPNFNPAEEDSSPLSRLGKDIEDGNQAFPNFANFTPTDNSPNTTNSLGPFNENKTEFPSSGLTELGNTFRPRESTDSENFDSSFGGDKHTLLQFGLKDEEKSIELDRTQYKENIEDAHPNDTTNGTIEGIENGMPFYFKDMRDGAFIFFRAYIDGLTEAISPSWNTSNYMGRSEPVYTYERAEREINFTLKLFAQTKKELAAIYEKMNRLTSMCYPEYYREIGGTNYGNRMKPPLTKLRIGDLYGKQNDELMGFLKGLSYSVASESPYSIDAGQKVPMFIEATIGYQVIHAKSPNLNTKFYGYIGDNNMANPQNVSIGGENG